MYVCHIYSNVWDECNSFENSEDGLCESRKLNSKYIELGLINWIWKDPGELISILINDIVAHVVGEGFADWADDEMVGEDHFGLSINQERFEVRVKACFCVVTSHFYVHVLRGDHLVLIYVNFSS